MCLHAREKRGEVRCDERKGGSREGRERERRAERKGEGRGEGRSDGGGGRRVFESIIFDDTTSKMKSKPEGG